VSMPVCCRAPSPTPPPYTGYDVGFQRWVTTWARILDHCADMNGAPLTRTPPRRSWGRGPPPPRGGGEFRPVGRRVFYCELCSADGSSPWS
jgi:hypothetical protein